MILRRLDPPGDPVDLDGPDAAAQLDALYSVPRPEWARVNLIMSIDGSAAGPDGTSATLTGGADRRILGAIRRAADVVLVGAATVRAEGFQRPKSAPLAIVTVSGDLSGHRIGPDGRRLVVVCPSHVRDTVRASLAGVDVEFVLLPAPITARDIVTSLRSIGLQSIVCEGGPTLARLLLTAGVIDELCLTTSPVAMGQRLAPFGAGPFSPLQLRPGQLLADDRDYRYARWLTSPATAATSS